jgi:PPOX class probable F420-dependent enzyme
MSQDNHREGEMASKLEGKPSEFLDQNPFVGVATTLRDDGSPHSTIVWVDVEDGKASFNTARGRAKSDHLEHDPRASLLMVDPNDSHKWVAVSGPARVTEEGADAQIDKLAKKYLGKDVYPWRSPDETRIKVVIEPEKVDATGFDE